MGRSSPSQANGVCQSIHRKFVNPSTGSSPTFHTGPRPAARFAECRKVMNASSIVKNQAARTPSKNRAPNGSATSSHLRDFTKEAERFGARSADKSEAIVTHSPQRVSFTSSNDTS